MEKVRKSEKTNNNYGGELMHMYFCLRYIYVFASRKRPGKITV